MNAARERFSRFGYGKTTMAEIAEDVGMSAANLYRYFENKQDIAAACASVCMDERLEALREVVRRPGLSAGKRLEELFLTLLRYTHEQAASQPRIEELVQAVARDRADIVHAKTRALVGLIAEILVKGNESGEFAVEDVIGNANAVYAATVLFGVPIFVNLYSMVEFEKTARNVARLIINGLRAG
jgi:AcrR family transcriptional regulator